jgi:hypothetical protein
VFWQRHTGSYFSFPNQLKEVITILIGFNLGAQQTRAFVEERKSIGIHRAVGNKTKTPDLPGGLKLEFVTPLFITVLLSRFCMGV